MSEISLGVLYPGYSGEHDYELLAGALGIRLDLLHTTGGADLHEEASLRAIGRPEMLIEQSRAGLGDDVAAVLWACTSGSFVFGWDGAREQARQLAEGLGVPATSTSLAFVSAARALGARRVAIAGTYPSEIAALFAAFLSDAGIEVVDVTAAGVMTGSEVGRIGVDQVVDLVRSSMGGGVDAIMVPDTALHTFEAMPRLEEECDEVVLTANQVTMWAGMHLLPADASRAVDARRALGVLHDIAYQPVG